MRRKNLRKLTPDEVLALTQLTQCRGWEYLKDIAEEMADAIEGPIASNETKNERIVRGAIFRRGIRGMFDAVEKAIEKPQPATQVERMLAAALNTQPHTIDKEVI